MTAQAGDTFSSKAQLRSELRRLRLALPLRYRRHAANRAARHLLQLPALREARRIALYFSTGSEIDTAPLIERCLALGLEVYVPRLAGSAMRFVRVTARTPLRRNRHGIAEPSGRLQPCPPGRLDVIVIPLVGFDGAGHRLGAGGGYYDRTLARIAARRRPLRVGLAYAAQEALAIPAEPWDVRLHVVVTEKGVRRWPTG